MSAGPAHHTQNIACANFCIVQAAACSSAVSTSASRQNPTQDAGHLPHVSLSVSAALQESISCRCNRQCQLGICHPACCTCACWLTYLPACFLWALAQHQPPGPTIRLSPRNAQVTPGTDRTSSMDSRHALVSTCSHTSTSLLASCRYLARPAAPTPFGYTALDARDKPHQCQH